MGQPSMARMLSTCLLSGAFDFTQEAFNEVSLLV